MSVLLLGILAAVGGLAYLFTSFFGTGTTAPTLQLLDFTWWLNLALQTLQHILGFIAGLLPAPASTVLQSTSDFFGGGIANDMISLGMWLISPVLDPALVTVCFGIIWLAYLMALLAKLITYAVSWVPSFGGHN